MTVLYKSVAVVAHLCLTFLRWCNEKVEPACTLWCYYRLLLFIWCLFLLSMHIYMLFLDNVN